MSGHRSPKEQNHPASRLSFQDSRLLLLDDSGQPAAQIEIWASRPGNDAWDHPVAGYLEQFQESDGAFLLSWSFPEDQDLQLARLKLMPWTLAGQISFLSGTLTMAGRGWRQLRLVLTALEADSYQAFVPACFYGSNYGGGSPWRTYPQLADPDRQQVPDFAHPWIDREWRFRTDRSSHALAAQVGRRRTLFIGGSDVCRGHDGRVLAKTGLSVSDAEAGRIAYSLGYVNSPYTYSVLPGRNPVACPDSFVRLAAGPASAPIFLGCLSGQPETSRPYLLAAAASFFAPDAANQEMPALSGLDEAIDAVAEALVNWGFDAEAGNFHITLSDDPRLVRNDFNTAWSGGLRVAEPLLAASRIRKRVDWRTCALQVLDRIADQALNARSGLLYENYDRAAGCWSPRGWWYRLLESPGHLAYISGQACYFLLKAYRDEATADIRHTNWLQTAVRVLDHICTIQMPDGRLGYTYSEADGRILDPDGYAACWFIPALALAWQVTGHGGYLAAARLAHQAYLPGFAAFDVFGGPADTFKSPDEESALAFIRGSDLLVELTGEPHYRLAWQTALDYELSWRYAYAPVPETDPLRKLNWSAAGGSITSVNNAHIHPMGSAVLADLLARARRGGSYDRLRFRQAWQWTGQVWLAQDGQYDWGRRGMINERFCISDSLLIERYPDGQPASTWFCAHSWASGAVLEGLCALYERSQIDD